MGRSCVTLCTVCVCVFARAGYVALYLRQTPNELTGEFTTIMVKPLSSASGGVDAPQVRPSLQFTVILSS